MAQGKGGIHYDVDGFCMPHYILKVFMQIESGPMPQLHYCEQDVKRSFYSVCCRLNVGVREIQGCMSVSIYRKGGQFAAKSASCNSAILYLTED